jgi:hypothetical protein
LGEARVEAAVAQHHVHCVLDPGALRQAKRKRIDLCMGGQRLERPARAPRKVVRQTSDTRPLRRDARRLS